jgi:hypothetical protein
LNELLAYIPSGDQWYPWAGLPPSLEDTWTLPDSSLEVSPKSSTSTTSSIILSRYEQSVSTTHDGASEAGQNSFLAWLRSLPSTNTEPAVSPSNLAGLDYATLGRRFGLNSSSLCELSLLDSSGASPQSANVSPELYNLDSNRDSPRSSIAVPDNSSSSSLSAELITRHGERVQPSRGQHPLLVRCRDSNCPKVSIGKRADE